MIHKSFAILFFFICFFHSGNAATKPNIISILVDDLGYSDLSSFGGKDIKTPAIDKLMNSGMRMNQFYSNCTVCTPVSYTHLTLPTNREV